MSRDGLARILCVDDEPLVLEALTDNLGRRFRLTATTEPEEALQLAVAEPFAVVLADMRMPVMDGARLLALVRQHAPTTVRILLTGQADVTAAAAAVNEGGVFRFLLKPCPRDALIAALDDGVEQHRLLTVEKTLLEDTLRGAVTALTDTLALTDPTAFGRGTRVRRMAGAFARKIGADDIWQIETAAMLLQIGIVSLPAALADKLAAGRPLDAHETETLEHLPHVADKLLRNIPRLDEIREILLGIYQPPASTIPRGALLLRIVLDFDLLESQGLATATALGTMRGRAGRYDAELLNDFAGVLGGGDRPSEIREATLAEVNVGMVFAADVYAPSGALLIARGYEATPALLERISNYPTDILRTQVRVAVVTAPHPV